jgi:hypothetical protein
MKGNPDVLPSSHRPWIGLQGPVLRSCSSSDNSSTPHGEGLATRIHRRRDRDRDHIGPAGRRRSTPIATRYLKDHLAYTIIISSPMAPSRRAIRSNTSSRQYFDFVNIRMGKSQVRKTSADECVSAMRKARTSNQRFGGTPSWPLPLPTCAHLLRRLVVAW